MVASRLADARRLPDRIRQHFAQTQHRTAYYLTLNNLMGAATGFLFWLLLARVGGLDAGVLGIGFTVVALGTVVAVLAKGGLDTALMQKVPGAPRADGNRLLVFAVLVGGGAALVLTAAMAVSSRLGGLLPDLTPFGWGLVGATAVLLVMTWLQDSYFVALGLARFSFERNVAFSAGRLVLPIPVVALAFAHPVPLTWALALAASAVVGLARVRRIPAREGHPVPRREFMRSATRNISGGAAEFLPGLFLAPLVLAVDGPESAAYFAIAWTAAALIFQTSGAIGRSALAQIIRTGPPGKPLAIRRAVLQNLMVVAPLALVVGLFAPQFLAIFGQAYAENAAVVLVILCASTVFVAPASLYLAVLRSRDRSFALVAFPALMILSLLIWAPALDARFGLTGVAWAWLLSNAPFGIYGAWRLRSESLATLPALPAPMALGVAPEPSETRGSQENAS